MAERKYTVKESHDMQMWNFTQTDPIWGIQKNIMLEKINNAKDNCFRDIGEISDFERGRGTSLGEFLVEIEAMADNGQKLINESQTDRSKES